MIEVRVREYDAEQGWVTGAREPRNSRKRQIHIVIDRERPAQIELEPRAVVLDLDAVTAYLVGAAMDPDSHMFNCPREGGLKLQPISSRHDAPNTITRNSSGAEAVAVGTLRSRNQTHTPEIKQDLGVLLSTLSTALGVKSDYFPRFLANRN